MFFDIAKKTGVLAKIDPELNAIVNDEFLTAMKKANSLSTTAKSAVLVDTIAAKSEQDVSAVATKYGLAVADEIKALREYGKRFAKVGSEDIEMLWPMVEAMTDKFNPKKEAVIDTVSELVAFKYPELAGQGDFNKKKENCHNIYSWGPTAVKVAKRLKGDIIKSGVPYTEADAMANDKAKSQIIEKVKTKGKRLTFVAFDTKDEHILRHMEGDFNPGSQFTLEDKGRNELFKSANNVLEDLLDEHGNPGRRVLAIKADKEIGTCGVMPIEYFDSSKVMTISRDVGNPSRHKGMGDQVHVVIIPDEDVVKTNTAYFIAGPYGNSGLYGPYTAFLAPYAPPFPNYDIDPKLAQDVKERIKKSNEENADAWSKLVMPMTETQAEGYLQTIQKEAEARHAKGDEANAKLLDVMSRTFENGLNAYRTNGKKSPVLDREKFAKYRPEIPSDALVVEVSIAPGGKQGNIKGKESGGR